MIHNIYLNLYERLSQTYLHQWCIVLALVMIKIYLFKRSVINTLHNLEEYSQELCAYINKSSSTLDMLPKNISNIINSLVIQNLNQLQYLWLMVLKLIITISQNLIVFFIEIFLGTFTCLLTATVSGTVDLALESTENVLVAVNETVIYVSKDIQDGLSGLSSIINSLLSIAGKIESFFSGNDYNPDEFVNKINLSIHALNNLSIPSSVIANIDGLKSDIPNFENLENSTLGLIKEPFRLISEEISKSSYFKLNVSIDDIPTFKDSNIINLCDDSSEIEQQFKVLTRIVSDTSRIILSVISVILLFVLISLFYIEWIKWKKALKIQKSLEQTNNVGNTLAVYENPVLYASYKLGILNTTGNNSRLTWLLNYCTSKNALGILILASIGFITILLQFIIIKKIQYSIELAETSSTFEEIFKNDSAIYINEVNGYLNAREIDINTELFGNLKNTTTSLNATINDFLVGFNKSVVGVFEGTVFASPISTVFYCVIGRKLVLIEKGLTWINKNLQITVPTLSNDTISSNFELNESVENMKDSINKKLNQIIDNYNGIIRVEFWCCLGLFSIWVLQLIVGILIIMYRNYNQSQEIVDLPLLVYKISEPKPLTMEEQETYAFPYTDLHSKLESQNG